MTPLEPPFTVVFRHNGQTIHEIAKTNDIKQAFSFYQEARRGHRYPKRDKPSESIGMGDAPGILVKVFDRQNRDVTEDVKDWAWANRVLAALTQAANFLR